MLGVGEFLPVDEGLAVALGDGMARAAVTVPGHDVPIACDLLLVRASDSGAGELALALAVREERTDLGAGLVRGLWYDAPVGVRARLGDGTSWLVEARVWRCCIAGPLFSDVLGRERAAGTEDVASAWELRVLGAKRVEASDVPAAADPSRAPREELHLDVLARRGGLSG